MSALAAGGDEGRWRGSGAMAVDNMGGLNGPLATGAVKFMQLLPVEVARVENCGYETAPPTGSDSQPIARP